MNNKDFFWDNPKMTTKSVTTLMTTQKVVTQLGDHTMTTPDHLDLSPFSLRKTFKTIEI